MQDLNNRKFELLIRAAVYDCHTDDVTMLEALDISSVKFDKAYLRRKKRILSEQKAINSYNHKKVVFNRIAITALIIISIIFGSIMSVSAVRESLWKTVTKWYDKYIDIYFNNYSYESSPPSEIEIVRKPMNISADWEENILSNDSTSVYIEYYKDNEFLFSYQQGLIQDGSVWINGENVKVTDIQIHGCEAKLSQNNDNPDDCQIIWNDGEYYYMISGYTLPIEQMIKIAESVK
ncbi:MAG: DUF4367 domain-containing protein [Oscillospiraceae bacterium]|nr:DUF4367 domain-containing protein [Oscillospiraceae bacterium]